MIKCPLALLIAKKNDDEGRRGNLKWSYRKMGEELGLSPTVLNRLNGHFERVDVDTIEKLCTFFGIGIDELLVIGPDDADTIKRKADKAQGKKKGVDEWTLNSQNLTA